MNTSIFNKEPVNVLSNDKTNQKVMSINVNPFFQYVTNNKLVNTYNSQLKTQNIKIEKVQSSRNSNQTKQTDLINKMSSQVKFDPRIANQLKYSESYKSKQENITQKLENQLNLKQRRSRSRQKKYSQHKDSQNRQKKDQHFRKTKLCPLFEKGTCKKGSQCHFAHGQNELRGLPNFVKTRICIAFKNGQCKKSSRQCKYAHGQQELRSLQYQGYSQNSKNNTQRKDQRRGEKYRKDQYRKNQQSVYKKQKHNRKSNSRDLSNNRQKSRKYDKSSRQSEQKGFYKKNIPINKQYERFLYGTSQPINQFNNQAYLVPHRKFEQTSLLQNTNLYLSPYDHYSQFNYKGAIVPSLPITDIGLNQDIRSINTKNIAPNYNEYDNHFNNLNKQKKNYQKVKQSNHQNYLTSPNQRFSIPVSSGTANKSYLMNYMPPEIYQPYSNVSKPQNYSQSYSKDKNQPNYLNSNIKVNESHNNFSFEQNKAIFSQSFYYPSDKNNSQVYFPPQNNQKYQPFYGASESQYPSKNVGNQSINNNFLNLNQTNLYPAFDNGQSIRHSNHFQTNQNPTYPINPNNNFENPHNFNKKYLQSNFLNNQSGRHFNSFQSNKNGKYLNNKKNYSNNYSNNNFSSK